VSAFIAMNFFSENNVLLGLCTQSQETVPVDFSLFICIMVLIQQILQSCLIRKKNPSYVYLNINCSFE
jgi:hypothetical protein